MGQMTVSPSGFVHQCVPSENPRYANTCARCGLMMEELRRDPDWEDQMFRVAVSGQLVDPEPLIHFAQRRADRGAHVYGRDFPSLEREFAQEIMDEIADAAIYVVWWLDAIRRDLREGGERVEELQRVLGMLTTLFEQVRAAR